MTLRLRHHHLLCLLTYVGKGYSPAFVANFDRIAARVSGGEEVLLVEGPDDICAPLIASEAQPHCQRDSVRRRDTEATEDLSRLLDEPLPVGKTITLSAQTKNRLRQGFAAGTARRACSGCQWHDFCSAVAAEGFEGARLT
ncbi:DUF1284 domain-containing protein [Algihabitans albus]|uniref:DUF1284 domain-containing protein n=1 Tax=Algihabitans albus TaxID=2164067 RepID=UPI000E5C63F7|nr:DUF1284 domain-containing protein [Algihabitans albus]